MNFKSATLSKARRHYTITMFTEPVAKGRPRAGKNRVFTPKKTREATSAMAQCLEKFIRDEDITPYAKGEALRVSIRFTAKRTKAQGKGDCIPKTTKPDIDNYIKLVLDAANASGIWHDDSQVVEILAQKVYAADYIEPNVTFEVRPL
jgi:Holliday junction resolvase RusA-like endonuclease